MLDLLREHHGLDDAALARIESIFAASDWMGFGNPRISVGALSRAECHARRAAARVAPASPECKAPNMVLAPGEGAPGVCVDQFEFPNVACEFPFVWVRSSEAQQICQAMGKRLCDAHEWEGGCAGRVRDPEEDYAWNRLPKVYEDPANRRGRRLQMEYLHNESREVVWAYGKELDYGRCGTQVRKDNRCTIVDWGICATRSFPAGSFPECVSPVGVYDQHGNVAEHMSLPLRANELGRTGGSGWTEMKGSWFAFAYEHPHEDDCRWRAKNWHTTAVSHWNSHRNYHLGFRCCKNVE